MDPAQMEEKIRILIVEDDFLSRKLLNRLLSTLGEVDIAINGMESISAVQMALNDEQPYQLTYQKIRVKIL